MTRRQRNMLIVLAALFVVALAEVGILRSLRASADKDCVRYVDAVLPPLVVMDSLAKNFEGQSPQDSLPSASNPFPALIDLAQMIQSGQPVSNVKAQAMQVLPSLSRTEHREITLSQVVEGLIARSLFLQDSMVRLGQPGALTALDVPFTPSVEEGGTYHHLMVGNVPDPHHCWLEPVEWPKADSSRFQIRPHGDLGLAALATKDTRGLLPAGQDSAVVPYVITLRRIPGSMRRDTIAGTFTVVR